MSVSKTEIIKVHLSPFHANIAAFGKLSFQVRPPYNEREVTIQVNPNLLDYQENRDQESIKVRHAAVTTPTGQSRTLSFSLDDNAVQCVRLDDTDYRIRLLRIGK